MRNEQKMVMVPRELAESLSKLHGGNFPAQESAIARLRELLTSAQQHQGEPVAYLRASDLERLAQPHVQGCAASLEKTAREGFIGIYTHADAGEVERLREELGNALEEVSAIRLQAGGMEMEIDELGAKLVERDTLLRRALEYIRADGGFTLLDDEIETALTASPLLEMKS